MRPALIIVAGAAGLAAFALWRRAVALAESTAAGSALDYSDDGADAIESAISTFEEAVMPWKLKAEPYAGVIEAAAERYGVPGDILLRVAYQESRFRDDIISGATKSAAGALGMFQFMPATARDFGIDPLDWQQAADGAARYLRQLKNKFGTWELALAAYNWGQGNVTKYLAGTKTMPTETRNYIAQIGADVSLA